MSGTWLDSNYLYTSNRYTRTYIQGFMDISGGNLIVRNNNLYLTQGDASINGNLILGYDASLNKRLFVGSDASFGGNLYIAKNVGIDVSGYFGVYDVCNNAQMVVDISGGVNLRGPLMGGLALPDNSILMTATPPLDLSNNFGTVWKQNSSAPTKNWTAISMSANGQYQTAVSYSSGSYTGYIYTSNNYGVTWTLDTSVGSAKNWFSLSISKNGKYQTAGVATGPIYTSNNYGITWTQNGSAPTTKLWSSISMSATGQYQTALEYVSASNGYIYTSSDYGATWTNTNYGGIGWTGISLSATGQYQTAVNVKSSTTTGYIHISTDYGATWRQVLSNSNSFKSVSMSANGQYQTALGNTATSSMYTSNDYGITWTQNTSAPTNVPWYSVSLSATGQYQCAVITSGITGTGGLYSSNNYGVTWTSQTSAPTTVQFYSVSMSSNGQYISACAFDDKIYTSVTPYNDLVAQNSLISYCDVSFNKRLFVGSDASINSLTVGRSGGNISTNTAFGVTALTSNTTGTSNTAIGYQAGYAGTANTTGTNNTYIGYQAQANANNYTKSTALGSGATITASNQVVLGTSTETVVIPNQINFNYTSNPTLSAGSIGYVYTYTVTGAGTAFGVGSTKTVASFTNTPVGIYLVLLNFTIYDVASNQRVDLTHSVATNITYLNNSTNLEQGGNSAGKIGFNATYPIKITNATNQLTILISNVSGTNSINITGSTNCLMRIA